MLLDEGTVRRLLALPDDAEVQMEEAGNPLVPANRITVVRGGERQHYHARTDASGERGYTHAAVVEALWKAGFPGVPRPVAYAGDVLIEEAPTGLPLTSIRANAVTMEAAVDLLASMHALDVREGRNYGRDAAELVPGEETPLHRLGFAAHEREHAEPGLRAAKAAILEGPMGFAHGELTAANVLANEAQVTFTGFGQAGYGSQVMDLAALLSTAGLDAGQRRTLAEQYARKIAREPSAFADLVDVAGLLWGITWELELPRRQILVMGDEGAMEQLVLMSSRVQAAFKEAAGKHPAAQTLREALWPSYDAWDGH